MPQFISQLLKKKSTRYPVFGEQFISNRDINCSVWSSAYTPPKNPGVPFGNILIYKPTNYYTVSFSLHTGIDVAFNELYKQWREKTKFHSYIGNSTDVYHEKIIQLGWDAVPLIIKKLKEDRAHLFIALSRITGENPVKKENMGKVKEMAEDWIQWWEKRQHGIS